MMKHGWQRTIRKALLVCGIVASLLYVTATMLGAMRYPGYSPTSYSVSELFAIVMGPVRGNDGRTR